MILRNEFLKVEFQSVWKIYLFIDAPDCPLYKYIFYKVILLLTLWDFQFPHSFTESFHFCTSVEQKWYSIAVLICTSLIVVMLRIFSCFYQPLVYLLLWIAYVPPWPNFLLGSLCLTGFLKDLFYDCDYVMWILILCCKYFSQIITYLFGGSGVRGHLSFNFMVTLIYETLHCVRHSPGLRYINSLYST